MKTRLVSLMYSCWLCLSLFCSLHAAGQQNPPATIFGRVVDASQQPIAGATVRWKSGTVAGSTDDSGRFVIQALSAGRILLVSCVGYEPLEMDLTGQAMPVTIRMQAAAHELDQVTVTTGYETLPKERATGSFEKIGQAQINLQNSPNILQRLQGITTGLLFDPQSPRPPLTLRGLSSINSANAPLVVLDNFPYEGDINNINPNDVESVTMLKDAAAASIWGARAGNGVIVISTKKGRLNQKLQVDVNANAGLREKPDLYYSPQFIAAADYVEIEQFLFGKGFYNSQENSNQKPALSPVVETLIAQRDGRISASEAAGRLHYLRSIDRRQQADNYLYSQPITQQYALSISGGGQKLASSFSIGYDRDQSELKAIAGRFSIRTDHRFQLMKNLELQAGGQYTQNNSQSGKTDPGTLSVANKQLPYIELADEQGQALPVAKTYRSVYTDTAGGGYLMNWQWIPLEDWQHDQTTRKLQDVLFNAGIKYQVIKDLALSVQYQYEQQGSRQQRLQDEESYEARNMVNRFSQVDRNLGTVKYIVPKGGMLTQTYSQLLVNNLRVQASYNKSWKKHQVNWLGGGEVREAKRNSSTGLNYGFDNELLTTGQVDYVNSYPDFVTGSKTFVYSAANVDASNYRYVSWYSNASYEWRQRYIVSGSIRKDASNLFGVEANERGVPLWSAGLAWVASKEGFWKMAWLPYAKLRATTGFSGNIDPSRSAYTTLRMLSGATGTNLPYANVNQFANPGLRWEKVQTSNIGLDFASRKNRVSGSVEWYIKKGTDLFGAQELDQTTGLQTETLTVNAASMRGTGFDIQLNTVNTTGSVQWNSVLLFSHNKTIVTDYFNAAFTSGRNYVSNGKNITPVEGQRLYQVVSYRWAGLDRLTGDPQGWLADTVSKNYAAILGSGTRADDIVYHGSATPEYFGSLGNTIGFRGLSLSVYISGKFGYYTRRSSIYYNALFNGGAGHEDYYRRWQQPGDELTTNVPSMTYPGNGSRDDFYNYSEINVKRADHIRLQFLQLNYTPQFAKFRKANKLQLYLIASNLGILWKADGQLQDPDYPDSRPARSMAAGLRLHL